MGWEHGNGGGAGSMEDIASFPDLCPHLTRSRGEKSGEGLDKFFHVMSATDVMTTS